MKYLLEIHHGIGDIVQYTGLIKSVKEYDKEAYVGIVINKEAYKALLKCDTSVDEIYVIDFSGDKKVLMKTIAEIRKKKYDFMVCSVHSRQKSMEFMALAFGARKVAGSRLDRLGKISKRFINVPVDVSEHVVKLNYDVLMGLGMPFRFYEPYLVCPEPPVKLSAHTIGLCIGTSIPQKTWDLERFIATGEYFERKGYSIALLGGKKEKEVFDESGYKNENWVNLLGKTDLIGSACECSECELIIGGDTGLMHMSAAVGTKTLTLFSCSKPSSHTPFSSKSYCYYVPMDCQFCFGSEKMYACKDYRCIKEIETEKIIEIADGILQNSDSVEEYRFKSNLITDRRENS